MFSKDAQTKIPMIPLLELVVSFGKLGLTSFGGPTAHVGYLRSEVVEKRKWMSDPEFIDLVSLCQFLPGPASSQMVFAIGMKRARLLGGLIASLCFTLPSAILLILFAYGMVRLSNDSSWMGGLKIAAVSVVLTAIQSMSHSLCPTWPRRISALLIAILFIAFHSAYVQWVAILFAGTFGCLWDRWERFQNRHVRAVRPHFEMDSENSDSENSDSENSDSENSNHQFCERTSQLNSSRVEFWQKHAKPIVAWLLFLGLLWGMPLLASYTQWSSLEHFSRFYRSGALVFGGGHVVLPLLRAELVPEGLVTDDQFVAGYGAAQAIPGPLFAFAAYLGTLMRPGPLGWAYGLWMLFAIFLPAWLLVIGTYPYWTFLRKRPWARSFVEGANVAVLGLLIASFVDPVCTEAIHDGFDVAYALLGYLLLKSGRVPSWGVVILLVSLGALG